MQFHEYSLSLTNVFNQAEPSFKRECKTLPNFYAYCVGMIMRSNLPPDGNDGTVLAEQSWLQNRRAFYNVYPAVTKCLQNTSLNIKPSQIGRNIDPVAICFAKGHEVPFLSGHVKSLVFSLSQTSVETTSKKDVEIPVMRIAAHRQDLKYSCFWSTGDDSIGEAIDTQTKTQQEREIKKLISICVGVSLLAKDERFAEPILLKRDEGKTFTPEQKQAAIERAIRNGRNGIAIGKDIEVSPHMRRPHFGIRWTEKGRSVPKLVPISGCLVSRSKLYPIPTGYLDDKEEKDE